MTMEKAGIGAEEHSRDGTFPTAPIPDLKFIQPIDQIGRRYAIT